MSCSRCARCCAIRSITRRVTVHYKVLSSDASTKHGFRPHAVIFDEFHAQPNRDLYEALKKSMVKRRQPVMVMISHAGDDDEGICYEEYEYAKKVLSGTVPDERACR
jgi:phage terminase large subunit-like protein